jgi:hypothetical protein
MQGGGLSPCEGRQICIPSAVPVSAYGGSLSPGHAVKGQICPFKICVGIASRQDGYATEYGGFLWHV